MSTKVKKIIDDELKEKVIDILMNYNKFKRDIKVLEENKELLEDLFYGSDELIKEMFIPEHKSSGKYCSDTVVEKQAFYNMTSKEITEKQIKKKREELRNEIEMCKSKIKYKSKLIRIFDNILNDMCESDKKLIELTYIDKKKNRYTWEDIVLNYNAGRRYALNKQTIENRQKELIQMITDGLRKIRLNISVLTVYRLGGWNVN